MICTNDDALAAKIKLYRDHGRRLNFSGMILQRIRYETFHGKEVIAQNAAQLAATLGAQGAIVAWLGSGNAFVDVMLTVRACELRGIATVLVTYEYGGKDGVDSPLLFYVPEADAVVSTGSRDRWLELPEAERLVGPYDQVRVGRLHPRLEVKPVGAAEGPLRGPVEVALLALPGAVILTATCIVTPAVVDRR